MKAIIIEEARFTEFCELLDGYAEKLKSDPQNDTEYLTREVFKSHGIKLPVLPETASVISKDAWRAMVNEIHRKLHYQFVTWAQSHGASCTTRN